MSYTPATDFLALLRTTPDGKARLSSMPGVDWLIAALARAGLVKLWTDPANAPPNSQSTTVWLKVSSTSWAAEGAVYLWDASNAVFSPATPALWSRLFQAVTSITNEVDATANTVLTSQNAGQLFTNTAFSPISYTLPSAVSNPGATFEFAATQAGLLTVLPLNSGLANAETIRWGLGASTVSISSGYLGAYVKLRSINGQWFVIGGEGTWILS